MLIPRCRSLLPLKSYLKLEFSSSNATATDSIASLVKTIRFAPFHSTSVLSEKSRNNFGSNRASNGGSGKTTSEGERSSKNEWHFGPKDPLIRDRQMKKKTLPGRGKKPRDKKTKRWHREGSRDNEFGADANNTFENKYRENWTTQSQKASYSRGSTSGYEWREGWSWTTQSQRRQSWNNEFCDEPSNVGSRSERTVLGLPLDGPIKIDDVKNAFRSAALMWHPDKHQGPSQAAAQERFKLCVDAYKSLSSALS